jgi:hypothetical protein
MCLDLIATIGLSLKDYAIDKPEAGSIQKHEFMAQSLEKSAQTSENL